MVSEKSEYAVYQYVHPDGDYCLVDIRHPVCKTIALNLDHFPNFLSSLITFENEKRIFVRVKASAFQKIDEFITTNCICKFHVSYE